MATKKKNLTPSQKQIIANMESEFEKMNAVPSVKSDIEKLIDKTIEEKQSYIVAERANKKAAYSLVEERVKILIEKITKSFGKHIENITVSKDNRLIEFRIKHPRFCMTDLATIVPSVYHKWNGNYGEYKYMGSFIRINSREYSNMTDEEILEQLAKFYTENIRITVPA